MNSYLVPVKTVELALIWKIAMHVIVLMDILDQHFVQQSLQQLQVS